MDVEQESRYSIDFTARPLVSYAMAHNGVSVLNRLVIDGPGTGEGTLHLDVTDANGPLSEECTRQVDLSGTGPLVLTDLPLLLDPAAMLQVEEQRPGTVRARLEIDGETRAEHTVRVRVLAAQQWLAEPLTLGLELLAAHVMPNHPAITALMGEVADRLLRTTGNPSIQGYQGGPDRVDEIVRAVFEVMQARGIRYCEPPASWADVGQKVRTPGEVLEARLGTCLDTVVVMAAALEQAGIRPLLWLAQGHAFLGYWREESSLGITAQTDVAEIVNRVDLDQVRLVETTMLTGSSGFADAQSAPRARLTGDLDQLLGVTDVWQARKERIVPLPARTRDQDGEVHVSLYTPPAQSEPTITRPAPTSPAPAALGEPARVAQWKNALLDLSLRNRLLNYRPASGLPIALPERCLGAVEDLLHQGTGLLLRPSDDVAAIDRERGTRAGRELPDDQLADLLAARHTAYVDVTDAAYKGKLRGLAHKARTIIEETGANNLYLALGTLTWELDGRALRSPLILIPVVLKTTAHQRYRVYLDETGTSTPNYCLVEKLRHVFGLDIPELANPVLDNAGIDLDATLQATRTALAEHGLRFRVEPTADLTVLQFAKFRLWKDLDESWPVFAANPLVRHLISTPTDMFADPVAGELIPDLEGLGEDCPVPADSSQLRAVADAVAGRTFVLEGPPGTGKSQTITNLLAHAVANGKRVLFVAEKRAALDVVHKRLNQIGMGPLTLDLHDKGSSPVAVRAQLKQALEHTVVTDQVGMAATLDDLHSARRDLIRYTYKLHDNNQAGLSLYGAEEAVLARRDSVTAMPIPPELLSSISQDGLTRLRALFRLLPDVAYPARPRPNHPWAFVTDPRVDPATVLPIARHFDQALRTLAAEPALRTVLAAAQVPEDLRTLATLLADGTPLTILDETRTPAWQAKVDAVRNEITAFTGTAHPGLDQVEPTCLDLPLGEIHAAAGEAASSGFFGRKKRLREVRDRLPIRPGIEVPPKKLVELTTALVAVADQVKRLAAKVNDLPGVTVPADWNPFVAGPDERLDYLRWAATVVEPGRAPFVEPLREFLGSGTQVDPAPIAEAATAAADLLAACHADPDSFGERGLVEQWETGRLERALGDDQLGSLRRWLALLAHLEPLRTEHLDAVRELILRGEQSADDALRAFELGLAVASIAERRSAGGLTDFDATTQERTIGRYVRAADQRRDQLGSELPRQVLHSRSFDPTTTGGRVGLLHRQITRQRGGMRVRELMSQFGDLITRAMPCVLVSPDSVARFFPAKADLFDIVVFDEASQVRVADAIGAMGRANSVVVVGDSKQMPPTSFAESSVTTVDLDDDEPVEDEESILTECVQARVERHRLSWHYRSQDESLIAFSNNHYYDGSLMSFPAPVRAGTGVSLVRVDGEFLRSGQGAFLRTNPIEAQAVVAEIRRRFAASPDDLPSLGVVTFNQQQRAHIEELLRDTEDERIIEALDDAHEGLFVKNLENVQGDERDVIFFSTAFSVNKRGVLPLNFGPLNRSGGERRLNVAVTRARRQVIVFASFDPSALRAEETTSVGVKHLRTYLDMAAHGASALPADRQRSSIVDRHGEDIADALRARGLAVRTRVGLSDFKIDLTIAAPEKPEVPLVAVLLDGPAWAARLTVRDRDGLPEEVLSHLLHWPQVRRVWLPDWLDNRDAVLDRLIAAAAPQPAAAWHAADAPQPFAAREPLGPPQSADAPQSLTGAQPPAGPEPQPLAGSQSPLPATAAPQPFPAPEPLPAPQRLSTPQPADASPSLLVPQPPLPPAAGQPFAGPQPPLPTTASPEPFLAPDRLAGPQSPLPTTDSPQSVLAPDPFAEPQPRLAATTAPQPPFPTAATPPPPQPIGPPARPVFVPWQPIEAGTVQVLDHLPAPPAAATVAAVMTAVVTAEGPIHVDRLVKLVAGAFGLNRVAESRRVAILRHLPTDLRKDDHEPVVWPPDLDPETWTGFRATPPDVDRPLEHVALREIANAMVDSARAAAGMQVPELRRQVLGVFGGRRLTNNISERLNNALELGIKENLLAIDAGGTVTA
ncbi:MAG TPA: DUF3320 domain-containing protein [Pseudonocardiaceae bacterium]